MNSLAYFRGAAVTSFAFILCILFGIRLASVFACTGNVQKAHKDERTAETYFMNKTTFIPTYGDECRIILFEEPIPNKAIRGHVIRRLEVPNEGSCRVMCYMEPDCVSINVRPSEGGKYKCELNNATVDENQLTFLDDRDTTYYLAIENPCRSSPCYNGSTCQVGYTSKGFRCICPTGFPGISCLKAKSCSDLKKLDPTAKNGSYVIDPDDDGGHLWPYMVTCDMSDKGGVGVTVISHDSENRTLVDGCEPPGCYSRDINYTGASLSQLESLTRVSLHCEQFIKYECRGSKMFNPDTSRYYAWWVSRNKKKMTYWHGVGTNTSRCQCGMNNTCVDHLGCNCDTNDDEWRADSGLLTNKSHLPVRQLRFGDVLNAAQQVFDAQGYHTLGKFKCYGNVKN